VPRKKWLWVIACDKRAAATDSCATNGGHGRKNKITNAQWPILKFVESVVVKVESVVKVSVLVIVGFHFFARATAGDEQVNNKN